MYTRVSPGGGGDPDGACLGFDAHEVGVGPGHEDVASRPPSDLRHLKCDGDNGHHGPNAEHHRASLCRAERGHCRPEGSEKDGVSGILHSRERRQARSHGDHEAGEHPEHHDQHADLDGANRPVDPSTPACAGDERRHSRRDEHASVIHMPTEPIRSCGPAYTYSTSDITTAVRQ